VKRRRQEKKCGLVDGGGEDGVLEQNVEMDALAGGI